MLFREYKGLFRDMTYFRVTKGISSVFVMGIFCGYAGLFCEYVGIFCGHYLLLRDNTCSKGFSRICSGTLLKINGNFLRICRALLRTLPVCAR